MNATIRTRMARFFTATIQHWKHLLMEDAYKLMEDAYKDIITATLKFLTDDKKVIIYGFVIMNNDVHIIGNQMATAV
jgi:putative transposase